MLKGCVCETGVGQSHAYYTTASHRPTWPTNVSGQ